MWIQKLSNESDPLIYKWRNSGPENDLKSQSSKDPLGIFELLEVLLFRLEVLHVTPTPHQECLRHLLSHTHPQHDDLCDNSFGALWVLTGGRGVRGRDRLQADGREGGKAAWPRVLQERQIQRRLSVWWPRSHRLVGRSTNNRATGCLPSQCFAEAISISWGSWSPCKWEVYQQIHRNGEISYRLTLK